MPHTGLFSSQALPLFSIINDSLTSWHNVCAKNQGNVGQWTRHNSLSSWVLQSREESKHFIWSSCFLLCLLLFYLPYWSWNNFNNEADDVPLLLTTFMASHYAQTNMPYCGLLSPVWPHRGDLQPSSPLLSTHILCSIHNNLLSYSSYFSKI